MNYIEKISKLSDRHGDKLLELMDRHKVNSIREIKEEQAKEYYEEIVAKTKGVWYNVFIQI